MNKKKGYPRKPYSFERVLKDLADDIGYENIYSNQLFVRGNKNDLLIALSGSGNSPNILNALNTGNKLGIKTFAILGFDGGKAKNSDEKKKKTIIVERWLETGREGNGESEREPWNRELERSRDHKIKNAVAAR